MWYASETNLQMAEGDYGIQIPFIVSGTTLVNGDSLKFVFKKKMNGDAILEKEYSNLEDNTANLEFTRSESELFPVGQYVYSLDWYQNGLFMCNLILGSVFRVVDKA